MIHNVGKKPLCHVRTACAYVQSALTILSSIDSVGGQGRPLSACTFAQANQGLCCPQNA